jgi:exosortase
MPDQPTDGILEEFRIEFLKYWERLPNKGFFFVLLLAWLALFQFLGNSTFGYLHTTSLIRWLWAVCQPGSEPGARDDAHVLILPFLVLGLFWWKRKELMEQPMRTWPPALLLVALGLVVHVVGYAAQQPKISVVALFIGLYGMMGLAWGPKFLRASAFPFFLFVFAVPLGQQADAITFRLRLLVCQLVEFVCHYILSIEIMRVGTSLRDQSGQYQYEVAAACSGLRSVISISLLAISFAFVVFRSNWRRVLLIASAIPLAVLGNLIRMLMIIIAAEIGGQKWGGYVHESTLISLIPYVPAIGGLLALGWYLERRKEQTTPAVA